MPVRTFMDRYLAGEFQDVVRAWHDAVEDWEERASKTSLADWTGLTYSEVKAIQTDAHQLANVLLRRADAALATAAKADALRAEGREQVYAELRGIRGLTNFTDILHAVREKLGSERVPEEG